MGFGQYHYKSERSRQEGDWPLVGFSPRKEEDKRNSSFKVIHETENGNNAWVQFSTVYEVQPETFKLIKEEGSWKVTEIEMGEKTPF